MTTQQPRGFWEQGDLVSLARLLLTTTQRGPAPTSEVDSNGDAQDVGTSWDAYGGTPIAGIRGYDSATSEQWHTYEDDDGHIIVEVISIPENPAPSIPGLRSLGTTSNVGAAGTHGHAAGDLNILTDPAPSEGGLRTLGDGERQGAPGNHAHALVYTRVDRTSSGVWNKPTDIQEAYPIVLYLIGAGGAGQHGITAAGGGGGGGSIALLRAGAFSSLNITVGAGGTASGGDTEVSNNGALVARAHGGQSGIAGANGGAIGGGNGGSNGSDGEDGEVGGAGGGGGRRVPSSSGGSGDQVTSQWLSGFPTTSAGDGGDGANGTGSSGAFPGGGGGGGFGGGAAAGGDGVVYIFYVQE